MYIPRICLVGTSVQSFFPGLGDQAPVGPRRAVGPIFFSWARRPSAPGPILPPSSHSGHQNQAPVGPSVKCSPIPPPSLPWGRGKEKRSICDVLVSHRFSGAPHSGNSQNQVLHDGKCLHILWENYANIILWDKQNWSPRAP